MKPPLNEDSTLIVIPAMVESAWYKKLLQRETLKWTLNESQTTERFIVYNKLLEAYVYINTSNCRNTSKQALPQALKFAFYASFKQSFHLDPVQQYK